MNIGTRISKNKTKIFGKNAASPYKNPYDNSTNETLPIVEEKFNIDDGNNLDDKIHLITKLVVRTNKFLNAKDIPLALSNHSQQLFVEVLLSTIIDNINFMKYDFTND